LNVPVESNTKGAQDGSLNDPLTGEKGCWQKVEFRLLFLTADTKKGFSLSSRSFYFRHCIAAIEMAGLKPDKI
jgi:hypothetical protein